MTPLCPDAVGHALRSGRPQQRAGPRSLGPVHRERSASPWREGRCVAGCHSARPRDPPHERDLGTAGEGRSFRPRVLRRRGRGRLAALDTVQSVSPQTRHPRWLNLAAGVVICPSVEKSGLEPGALLFTSPPLVRRTGTCRARSWSSVAPVAPRTIGVARAEADAEEPPPKRPNRGPSPRHLGLP